MPSLLIPADHLVLDVFRAGGQASWDGGWVWGTSFTGGGAGTPGRTVSAPEAPHQVEAGLPPFSADEVM